MSDLQWSLDREEAQRMRGEWLAERKRWTDDLATERAAREETKRMLDICSAVHNHNVKLKADLESTRAALAKAEARVAAALDCAKGVGEPWASIGPRMLEALRGS